MDKPSWKGKFDIPHRQPKIDSIFSTASDGTINSEQSHRPQKYIVLTKPNLAPPQKYQFEFRAVSPSVGLVKSVKPKLPVLPAVTSVVGIGNNTVATSLAKPLPIVTTPNLNMPKKPTMTPPSPVKIVPVIKRASSASPKRNTLKKIAAVVHRSPKKSTAQHNLLTNGKVSSKEKSSNSKKLQNKFFDGRKNDIAASDDLNSKTIDENAGKSHKNAKNYAKKSNEKLEKLIKDTYTNKNACVMCKKVFDHKDMLANHFGTCDLFLPLTDPKTDIYIYRKDGYDYISCEYIDCSYQTPFKENYRKHVIEVHTKLYLHNCYVCGKGFVDKYEKITHACVKRSKSLGQTAGYTGSGGTENQNKPGEPCTDKNSNTPVPGDNTNETQNNHEETVKKILFEKRVTEERPEETRKQDDEIIINVVTVKTKLQPLSYADDSVKPVQKAEVIENNQEQETENQNQQHEEVVEDNIKERNIKNELGNEETDKKLEESEKDKKLEKCVKEENNATIKVEQESMEVEVQPIIENNEEEKLENETVTEKSPNNENIESLEQEVIRLNLEQLDKGNKSYSCRFLDCVYQGKLQISFVKHFVRKHRHPLPFPCPECSKRFFSSETRNKHINEIHRRPPASEDENLMSEASSSKDLMSEPSSSKDLMSEASSSKDTTSDGHASNTIALPKRSKGFYVCQICTYKTRTAKNYRMHSWRHSFKGEFKCGRCHLSYKLQREFSFHGRLCRSRIRTKPKTKRSKQQDQSLSDATTSGTSLDVTKLKQTWNNVDECHSDSTIDSSDNEFDITSFEWQNEWVDDEFLRIYGSVESQLGMESLVIESDSSLDDFDSNGPKKKRKRKHFSTSES